MTIEQLLNCSAAELEAMSDAQLEAYFAPYLDVTRPERAAVNEAKHKGSPRNGPPKVSNPAGLEKARQYLLSVGIDMNKLQ